MSRKIDSQWYLGLDIGTNSIGWAITDEHYNLLRHKGKDLWGSYLFEEAQTAKERRTHRSDRRRLMRRKIRQQQLRELFQEEINKVDPDFYLRLAESKYYEEDKKVKGKYSIFNDKSFNDKDYFKKFPTIFHLRKHLIESNEKEDIRFYFLALNDLMKNRGHFLFEGKTFTNAQDTSAAEKTLFDSISHHLEKENSEELKDNFKELIKIAKEISGVREKERKTKELIKDKKLQDIFYILYSGNLKKLTTIFEIEELKEVVDNLILGSDKYEQRYLELEQILQDKIELVDALKAMYDSIILSRIIKNKYLSFDQVNSFEKHKKDLKNLKKVILTVDKEIYDKSFKKILEKVNNYVSYIGKTNDEKADKCNQEEVNKYFLDILIEFEKEKTDILAENNILDLTKTLIKEAELNLLLPKQISAVNGVIPYQIHEFELEVILNKLVEDYPSFNEIDEGYRKFEKIHKIFTFKIPYYIGPLNNHSKFAWLVRNIENEKIRPWNWEKVINLEETQKQFIARMVNNCTYFYNEKVLPKESIIYNRFRVFNELNQIKINGETITLENKNLIYTELFEKVDKVTKKKVINLLKRENKCEAKDFTISGLAADFESSLSTERKLKNILVDRYCDDLAEELIYVITYSSDDGILKRNLEKVQLKFNIDFTKEQLSLLMKLKFNDWGRLSRKLIVGIEGMNNETGETGTILHFLKNSNDNFMKLLSSKYTFKDIIEKEQNSFREGEKLTHEVIEKLNISPSVKKSMREVLNLLKDFSRIFNNKPTKIFIEMARGREDKPTQKDKRYDQLKKLYDSIKDYGDDFFNKKEEVSNLKNLLTKYKNDQLQQKKLYLYFLQMGRCIYTGEKIDLEELKIGSRYDIDHIIPRSMKTDDSIINNLVLTNRDFNNNVKSNIYPIPEVAQKQRKFWKFLKDCKLMSEEKYNRLVRREKLSNEELAGFIERQLVETRQSTKYIASLLNYHYVDTTIVYVKAELISKFRQEFEVYKCRDLNDTHHAQDAYLNIVVGNCYYERFTVSKLIEYISKNRKEDSVDYSLNIKGLLNHDIKGKKVWDKDKDLARVKKIAFKNSMLIVHKTFEKTGELFNATHVKSDKIKKGSDYLPLKNEDRLKDINKYGAYGTLSISKFVFVKYIQKNNIINYLVPIPVYICRDNEKINEYIKNYKLNNSYEIICNIPINSVFKIDGLKYSLTDKTDNNGGFKVLDNIYYNNDEIGIFKEIVKVKDKKQIRASSEVLDNMFLNIIKKIKVTKLSNKKKLPSFSDENLELFKKLSIEKKCECLLKINRLFTFQNNNIKFDEIGITTTTFVRKSLNIEDDSLTLIIQSPSGVFEERKELIK